jgi:MiaB/RimO family radical SAM methylthiotransferase
MRSALSLTVQKQFLSTFSRNAAATASFSTAQAEQQDDDKKKAKKFDIEATRPLSSFLKSKASEALASDDVESSSSDNIFGPSVPSMDLSSLSFHIKTYGCQMNVNDTDIIRSILLSANLNESVDESSADILLTNTCAIREGAENKVFQRINRLRSDNQRSKGADKIIGIVGCMAERLKTDLFDNGVDMVVGPDAYRDLPNLINDLSLARLEHDDSYQAVNVQLSLNETYADIAPVRRNQDNSAFISVMRGCNNMCSYCVVPFTRGRERSRDLNTIVGEAQKLIDDGVKEIVLLGQNVNSYHDKSVSALSANPDSDYSTSNSGFKNLYKLRGGSGYYFADLVAAVSDLNPEVRVRYTSPHPKDFPVELLQLVAERENVCNMIHMPAQSGSTTVLESMRRGYSREAYLELIAQARGLIPGVTFSSDFISGFCGETEEEHRDTVTLMQEVGFDQAFMFAYSMRGKTHAHRKMVDDVEESVKLRRLNEVIETFHAIMRVKNVATMANGVFDDCVLVEGHSRKSSAEKPQLQGRTSGGRRVVFDDNAVLGAKMGDYVVVSVNEAMGNTWKGEAKNITLLNNWRDGIIV